MGDAKQVNTAREDKKKRININITDTPYVHLEGTAVTASYSFQWWHRFTPMSVCWLRTQQVTTGPSALVSDYFVSHTDIIKTQHNLFTAQRKRVLAVLIPLTGKIAVMIGFAGNTGRHMKTSTISD